MPSVLSRNKTAQSCCCSGSLIPELYGAILPIWGENVHYGKEFYVIEANRKRNMI